MEQISDEYSKLFKKQLDRVVSLRLREIDGRLKRIIANDELRLQITTVVKQCFSEDLPAKKITLTHAERVYDGTCVHLDDKKGYCGRPVINNPKLCSKHAPNGCINCGMPISSYSLSGARCILHWMSDVPTGENSAQIVKSRWGFKIHRFTGFTVDDKGWVTGKVDHNGRESSLFDLDCECLKTTGFKVDAKVEEQIEQWSEGKRKPERVKPKIVFIS